MNKELKVGKAIHTSAGDLPCKYIIHVVGPQCEEEQEDIRVEKKQLKRGFKNIMNTMLTLDINSLSIPAISTRNFNFPVEILKIVYAQQIKKFIDNNQHQMRAKEIILSNFDKKTTEAMKASKFKI